VKWEITLTDEKTETTESCPHMEGRVPERGALWESYRAADDVYQDENGVWQVTRKETVRYALQHPEVFSSAKAYNHIGCPVPMIPLNLDPPNHVRYRRVLDPMFAPKVLDPIEPELRRQAGDLIDRFAGRGHADIVKDFAELYPTQVFLTMFGLPIEDRDQFLRWINAINGGAVHQTGSDLTEHDTAATNLTEYLRGFIEIRRRSPGDDMFSRILAVGGEDLWGEDEILGFTFLFALAGLDTVTGELGFVFEYLASHPEIRAEITINPGSIDAIVEEILRLDPVTPRVLRMTSEEVELGGKTIPANSPVQLMLAAANRDPRAYVTPDAVDVQNVDAGHLTFGGGIHRCIGARLARRELRIVLEEFHKRIPDYKLAPEADRSVVWPSSVLGLSSLPITFPV
jgi:cytochrome P450